LLFTDRPNDRGVLRSEGAGQRAAARSLQRLWRSGFIGRRTVFLTSKRTGFGYQHFVNVLTKKGATALQQQTTLQDGPPIRWTQTSQKLSLQTIEHALAINDFYVLVRRSAEDAGIGFHLWHDDRQLNSLNNRQLLKLVSIPDAFFVLEKDGQFFGHFLEIDTGSETVLGRRSERSWIRKILAYGEYFREQYPQDGFFRGFTAPIVLTVTSSHHRRDSLLQATMMARGRGVYWYTTLKELESEATSVEVNGRLQRVVGRSSLWQPIWRVVGEEEPRSLLHRLERGAKSGA
jgi:hypothetical protein